MICRIAGTLIERRDQSLLIDVQGVGYEILVPRGSRVGGDARDGRIALITFHYVQTDQSKSVPVLIGFGSEIEKEFFEKFITVSGIGPKAAVRALSEPVSVIAQAIDSGNAAFLKGLPGIGPQRAKEIIAKLQGKVGKFALIPDNGQPLPAAAPATDAAGEALEVLLQLQYKRPEAEQMVRRALERNPQVTDVEALLNEVYRQKSQS
ncbi:MAG: Holliday junction branch migration protein RuvA [Candidatus Omnitrophica bacterium]|nr:Holliday junction branch migration protein RuvA [Candidatus Omnitrophota bacterium]